MVHLVGMVGAKKLDVGEAEVTLRLIAGLSAPRGLEDRVHAHLIAAPRKGRVFPWAAPVLRESGWMRSVAAAAIVCVVAGGGWGVYAHVMPGQAVRTLAGAGMGEPFSTGEARRRPQTLEGPALPPAATPKATAIATKVVSKPATKHVHAAQVGTVSKANNPTAGAPVQ